MIINFVLETLKIALTLTYTQGISRCYLNLKGINPQNQSGLDTKLMALAVSDVRGILAQAQLMGVLAQPVPLTVSLQA